MKHHTGIRRIAAVALPLALVLLTGCPPRGPRVAPPAPPPLPIGEAMAAVNDNFAGINQTLSGGAMHVAAVVHDEDGKVEGHPDLAGTLRFHPPHDLYLDLKHALAGTIMHVGSNDQVFWVWVKLGRDTLWYGRWADLDPRETNDMLLSPDMILAGMGLAPLPRPGAGLRGPLPQIDEGQYYRLLYVADTGGVVWVQREYWLDRFPPYLPRVVVFRLPDGKIRMKSMLNGYERVKNSGVYVAREIHMEWPEHGDTFTMRLGTPDFKDVPPGAFEMNKKKIPVARDRWIAVGKQTRSARPAAIEPAATYPASSAASEPIMTQPDAPAPAMEPESSPE